MMKIPILILFFYFFSIYAEMQPPIPQPNDDAIEMPEEIPNGPSDSYDPGSAQQNIQGSRGRDRVFDPSTVPFRAYRKNRQAGGNEGADQTRKNFAASPTQINPAQGARAGTGSPATGGASNVVIAGPEYNKDKASQVPKDLKPTLIEGLDFKDAEINDVIRAISKTTKKNFILDNNIKGKITIISPSSISIEDYWRAFLTALEMNDLTTVETGAYTKIVKRGDARYTNIKTYSGAFSPDNDELITRFIQLQYIDAEEIANTLRELVSRSGGRIFAYSKTNTLIITDSGSNIKRLIKIINEMDVPGFEEKLDIIPVKYASASEIAEKITTITEDDDSKGGGSRRGGFRRQDNSSSPSEFKGKIIPDDRTNTLIVLATQTNLLKLKKLLKKIDYATRTNSATNIHIHYLKNATAEEVAATLTGLTSAKGGASVGDTTRGFTPGGSSRRGRSSSSLTESGLFSGKVSINFDKPTNSLVIVASPQDYDSLKEIIAKLDKRRKQVFVEAVIAEVTISKGKDFGISGSYIDKKKGIFSFGSPTLNSLNLSVNPTALFAEGGLIGAGVADKQESFDPGSTTGSSSTSTNTIKLNKWAAVVKALYSDSDINVLSTPQILATDNEDASIEVGDSVALLTSVTPNPTGGPPTQNIGRESVGIKLKITPQVNETSEYVKLKIEQEANDLSNRPVEGAVSNSGPTILKRTAKTTIVVKDQDMASIGGLIRDRISENVTKIPLLGDLPLLGWLFRNKGTGITKTNLLLLIKPTIISAYDDLRKIYHQQAESRKKFVTRVYGEEDIHQKDIDATDALRIDREKKGEPKPKEEIKKEEVEKEKDKDNEKDKEKKKIKKEDEEKDKEEKVDAEKEDSSEDPMDKIKDDEDDNEKATSNKDDEEEDEEE